MIEEIKKDLSPIYKKLNTHPIYNFLNNKKNIIIFMENHIYAVWDFMNILKYLQINLTGVKIPWIPYKNPKCSRLINEIVLEEESDIIGNKITSHFKYYSHALTLLSKKKSTLIQFEKDLQTEEDYHNIISKSYIPLPAKQFLLTTKEIIESSLIEVASSFTFAREALVPYLFEPITKTLKEQKNTQINPFINYLERHIQLDGSEHSKLAFELIEELVFEKSDWDKIKKSANKSLNARLKFFNQIQDKIQKTMI